MASSNSSARLAPVERKRLTDLAHIAIRESIVSGGLAMGERLVEARLAEDLGMSRAPVREAIQRLAKEGLVSEHPHHGAFVTELAAKDVVDLYNVRLGIEATAVRLFMKRGASTEALWAKVESMKRAADRGDMTAVVRAEFEFHRSICDGADNALLDRLFSEQEGRLRLVLALDDSTFERLHDVAAEHEPVVRAIESGDEAAAALAMEEHVLSTIGEALERLGGDPDMLLTPRAAPADRAGGARGGRSRQRPSRRRRKDAPGMP